MATNKKAPKVFTSLLDDAPAPAPARPAAKAGKRAQLAFFVDDELKNQLDRIVFWHPKGAPQREVLQQAIAFYVQQHPDAQRPMPREQGGEE